MLRFVVSFVWIMKSNWNPTWFVFEMNSIIKGCGYKSVVRYDKFDSLSLPLPEIKNPGVSLGHLLSEYVSSENLTDVTCESCSETCNHTKSVTFAKVKRLSDIQNSIFNMILKKYTFYIIFHYEPVTCMFVYSYFTKHLVSNGPTIETTRLCTFSRKFINGTVQFYPTKSESGMRYEP